jgi:AcrR family transcriptional regulator
MTNELSSHDQRIVSRRSRILSAAARVFAEKGFRHATIRDVANAAKIADGTIYNYFKNKDALLTALFQQLSQSEQAPLLEKKGDLQAVVLARIQQLHDQYDHVIAVLPEILGTPELRAAYLQQFVKPVAESVQHEIENQSGEAGLISANPVLAARILMAAVLGFQVLMVLDDPVTKSAWEHPDVLAEMWTHFIKAVVE